MNEKLTVFRAGTKDGLSFSFSGDHSVRGMIKIYLCLASAKNVKNLKKRVINTLTCFLHRYKQNDS